MIRRPPRSTRVRSSAASDVYKRQRYERATPGEREYLRAMADAAQIVDPDGPVSYTHLRAHETPEHLVCRLLRRTPRSTRVRSSAASDVYKRQRYERATPGEREYLRAMADAAQIVDQDGQDGDGPGLDDSESVTTASVAAVLR